MTFTIEYAMVLKTNKGIEYIDNKEIRVKNQPNELGAKCALEEFLKRKYGNYFIHLEVKKCERDIIGQFNELFGYGGRNPFGGFGL